MAEPGITLGLKFQSRVLCPQVAQKDRSQWLVATNCLREENEVRFVEYDPGTESVRSPSAYVHRAEVWDLAACPSRTDRFFTVNNDGGEYHVNLWSTVPGEQVLNSLSELPDIDASIRRVLWHPKDDGKVATVEEGKLETWSVAEDSVKSSGSAPAGELQQLWSGSWCAEDTNTLCTAGGNGFQIWDLRAMQQTKEVDNAHEMPVRDVDFAGQQQGQLATCGDDCAIRIWDLRQMKEPTQLSKLNGHSHWVWKCRFNPHHNQLLLSSSSDSLVLLWSTKSAGTAPEGSPKGTSPRCAVIDDKAHTYDDHEDSVYGLAWSCVEPFVFASVSYDGRVVVNKVPSAVKYEILI
ncbi:unnamed protein product [Ostreobium quekettii]|uniref:EIPR1-like beta-propeller domain-containing protein n=1 Tax=Ostreobium quekettii TaxID=121088 RepID=A0A8S1JHN4_9CHLO|nr:unnamed protein product [Ostreobium quekettii]|eukprot:evm.model.scf_1440.9 EVM.evm.TU.scf_1440.9   scf_1440:36029-41095(-)